MPIGIKTQGRTGNRMFQFAFGLALSKKLNTSFFVEDMKGLEWLVAYYKCLPANSRVISGVKRRHKLKRIFRQAIPNTYLGLDVISIDDWHTVSQLEPKFKDNSFYMGYFQSYDFFKDSVDEVKDLFRIKESSVEEFRKQKRHYLNEKYVAVHIRREDYINWQLEGLGDKDYSLPVSYYLNCLRRIKDIEKKKIVFLSDDADFYKKHFGHLPNGIYERNSPEIDFQLLQHADSVILSNSTFAWWAAFLGDESQHVFAPEFWLGFKVKKEFPCNIIKEGWIKVSTQ